MLCLLLTKIFVLNLKKVNGVKFVFVAVTRLNQSHLRKTGTQSLLYSTVAKYCLR